MAGTTTDMESKLPGWFSSTCDSLWKVQRAFWTLLGIGVLASLAAFLITLQWPFATNKSLNGTFLGWCFQNSVLLLVICLLYLACFFVVYIGHRYHRLAQSIPAPPSTPTPEQVREQQLREEQQRERQRGAEQQRRYLQRMMRDTENLSPKGVPGVVASVPLDEVFIPLQFKPGQPPSDKPITEEERRLHREWQQHYGHLYAQETSEELERVLFSSEQEYERILKGRDRVDFTYLWQNCTPRYPAAVIQGYPGMGKSTLTRRLALYMARRGLNLPDPGIAEADDVQPILLPLLIPLKEYADALESDLSLSLESYLTGFLQKLGIPGVEVYGLAALKSGRCLVMLDGLDEVSNPSIRKKVQDEIAAFVAAYADVSPASFNRFLITSRVAGYDRAAFPDYPHYLIADLSPEQIHNFLPRWCRANVRNIRFPGGNADKRPEQEEAIIAEANKLAKELKDDIENSQGVRDMAENPLLLTLLAVMKQTRGILPHQRVELYKEITKLLLENRNMARQIDPIPENQAIAYLSPLAFRMQRTGNSFAREHEVLLSLQQTIQRGNPALTDADAMHEAQAFLFRVRERSGLFVQRTGDYFGFMHRTFQEYFAAHFLLNAIHENQQRGIEELLVYVRQAEDTWREPFLFAVAYQSDSNGKMAAAILQALLNTTRGASREQISALLLAAECMIEVKPLSIDSTLERNIAARLLQSYAQAQREQNFDICQQIERMIQRWVLSLPKGDTRLSLPAVLRDAITDSAHVLLQRATLTLLAMIAPRLADCPPDVFATLLPPLLALAGLPSVGNYHPAAIAESTDLDVADLALTVLSFLGKPGPSGILLTTVQAYFKEHPDHLRLLARYSLESDTLITPAVVPLNKDNYRRYEKAIEQWIELRDYQNYPHIFDQTLDKCLNIHQSLLEAAEEVIYPSALLLLELLQESTAHPEQRWQEIWQGMLESELNQQSYIAYQQACLLWITLFIDSTDQVRLTHLLLAHYNNFHSSRYHYVLRFFTNMTEDIRSLRYIRFIRDARYIRDLRELRYIRDPRDLRYLRYIKYVRDLRYLRYLRYFRYIKYVRDLEDIIDSRYIIDNRYVGGSRYIIDSRYIIFTQDVVNKTMKRLVDKIEPNEQIDLLSLLLGRVLHIVEENQRGEPVEREVHQIVQTIYPVFTSASNELIRDAALDILRSLPARSVAEINFVLQLAEDAEDAPVQRACTLALRYAAPKMEKEWRALEAGKHSRSKEVRDTVEERVSRRVKW